MGGSVTMNGVDRVSKAFNGANSDRLGWYHDKVVSTDRSWSGRIYGLVDYDQDEATTVIVKFGDCLLPECEYSRFDFYATFNLARGFNEQTDEGADRVVITTIPRGLIPGQTLLIGELDVGETLSLPFFFTNDGFTLTVSEINLSAAVPYAQIEITYPHEDGDGSFPPLAPGTPVETLEVRRNSRDARKGQTFNIQAKNDISIVGFDLHMEVGTYIVDIWSKPIPTIEFGKWNDFMWTRHTSMEITGRGRRRLTTGPTFAAGINIPAGETWTILILLSPVAGDLPNAADNALYTQTQPLYELRRANTDMNVFNGLELYGGTGWPGSGAPVAPLDTYTEFEGTIQYIVTDPNPSTTPVDCSDFARANNCRNNRDICYWTQRQCIPVEM